MTGIIGGNGENLADRGPIARHHGQQPDGFTPPCRTCIIARESMSI